MKGTLGIAVVMIVFYAFAVAVYPITRLVEWARGKAR